MKRKYRIEITAEFGSDFQESVWLVGLKSYLLNLGSMVRLRHKENRFAFDVFNEPRRIGAVPGMKVYFIRKYKSAESIERLDIPEIHRVEVIGMERREGLDGFVYTGKLKDGRTMKFIDAFKTKKDAEEWLSQNA